MESVRTLGQMKVEEVWMVGLGSGGYPGARSWSFWGSILAAADRGVPVGAQAGN